VNSAKPFARLSHTAAAATLLAAAVLALSAAVATAGGAKRARTSSEPGALPLWRRRSLTTIRI
jgi:hypothetical protein